MKNNQTCFTNFLGGILAIAAVSTSSVPAYASSSSSGYISSVIVNHQGRMFFYQSGTRDALPACSQSRWVIDITNATGQASAALVLTALSQNKAVIIAGTGDCSDWPDTESISYLQVVI